MGKPRMIILIRHAQSEGNRNRDIHQTVPDHRVKLTQDGWQQAEEAGTKLRSMLRSDDTLHFFTSPYQRTRETTEGILRSLTSESQTPSPFPRHSIKVYEEPRLREQDFGNFQPDSSEMERMWQERADYGHFFYRIPNGESAADAYDRISGFNESLWRQFGEDTFASVCVLVTHGLMTRVFLMKWYHFSVEYFEDLRNVNHCEFVIMKKNDETGRYALENRLRTWSEWKKQKHLKEGEQSTNANGSSEIPVRKEWGGCFSAQGDEKPGTVKEGDTGGAARSETIQTTSESQCPEGPSLGQAYLDQTSGRSEISTAAQGNIKDAMHSSTMDAPMIAPSINRTSRFKASRVSVLRTGRDGGGSWSGVPSEAGSSDEDGEAKGVTRDPAIAHTEIFKSESGMGTGAKADALGDQSETDPEDEDTSIALVESAESSVRSSVY